MVRPCLKSKQNKSAGDGEMVCIAVIKNHDCGKLEKKGKGFIWLTLDYISLKEIRTRTQTREKPGGRS